MEFWLVDVKSTVNVNGKDIAMDYINTYFNRDVAIAEAQFLSLNEDVISISVHKWILNSDGTASGSVIRQPSHFPKDISISLSSVLNGMSLFSVMSFAVVTALSSGLLNI